LICAALLPSLLFARIYVHQGLEAIHDDWDMSLGDEVDEGGDPPRIWSQDGAYPGTTYTHMRAVAALLFSFPRRLY